MATVFATARKRTLDAVKLVHANAPFESAADRCDFTYFDSAALCATSTADVAKLREDAQKVFSIISGDTLKIQAYCEIADLGGQLVEAAQEKDEKKTDALMQSIDELEKVLGPEYPALFNHFMKLTKIPKMFRTSCQCSLATRPVLSGLTAIVQASPTKCGKNIVVACWANDRRTGAALIRTDRS